MGYLSKNLIFLRKKEGKKQTEIANILNFHNQDIIIMREDAVFLILKH